MKIKNKGKVYPSPSSSSSSAASDHGDVLSVLKLLPAAILALASVLSLDDREVLAYMITRSLKTSTSTSTSTPSIQDSKKKFSKRQQQPSSGGGSSGSHKSNPFFDCECFDCYTSYWFRWDSSPNRELIHQVIEAFEDHLANGEHSKKNNTPRGKRREKTGSRRVTEKSVPFQPESSVESTSESSPNSLAVVVGSPDDDVSPAVPSEKAADGEQDPSTEVASAEEMALTPPPEMNNHKGLARKVLPDVLGLLNSRLWNLWGPNV